jgi:hypothetical protein
VRDVLITAAPEPAQFDRGTARRGPGRWALLLLAGWLVEAALRAWFSRMQVVPLANPDESAYLEAARVLAGGVSGNFSGGTMYQGGYPLLIAPIYWFTSNSVTVYHAVMVLNALVGATLMPLAYQTGRRLGLGRRTAYGLGMVTAVLPAGLFYGEYALSDAIFPVVVLAWLLCTHSLLSEPGRRRRYAAAVSSALLAGYALAVHPRGLVIAAGYAVLLIFVLVRRFLPRAAVAVAGSTFLVVVAAAELLNRYLAAAMYPEGARSLSGQALSRLTDYHGQLAVLEMAGGQLWRVTTDTWGIGTIGLVATVAAVAARGIRRDLRIMAALTVLVTLAIVYVAPAALPSNQAGWVSGRYMDCLSVVYFLVGAFVLLRARPRWILRYAAAAVAVTAATAALVAGYAGVSLPTDGFSAFEFGEPSVLAQGWTSSTNIYIATAVAVGLLALWVTLALALRGLARWAGPSYRWLGWRSAVLIPVAAMNLFAVAQMTAHISQAGTPDQAASSLGFVTRSGLQPDDQVGVDNGMFPNWVAWIPQTYQVWWTRLQFFNGATSPPPAGVTVVEVYWQPGQSAQASWPDAPAGWHVAASDRTYSWVAWRLG